MKNAEQTIIDIICGRVFLMNELIASKGNLDVTSCFERYRNEISGMMICLKNITETNRIYNLNFYYDRVEFGYYDDCDKWNVVK